MLEFAEVAAWLKTTILGIILLGALGSILSVALILAIRWLGKTLHKYLSLLLPAATMRMREWALERKKRFIYRQGYEMGRMTLGDPRGFVAYFAFQLSRGMFWFVVSAYSGTSAIVLLLTRRTPLLSYGSYALLVIAMLSFFWASKHVFKITLASIATPSILAPEMKESEIATTHDDDQSAKNDDEEKKSLTSQST